MRLFRFLPLLALLTVVVLAAGCGGSGKKSVPSDSVAVVGSKPPLMVTISSSTGTISGLTTTVSGMRGLYG